MTDPLLDIENVQVSYMRHEKRVYAVNNVSMQVAHGENVALVGESGCGKTTLARMVVGLEKPQSGQLRFDGRSLINRSHREWKTLREQVQMIFQDPYSSLNPRMKIGQCLEEVLSVHGVHRKSDRHARVAELLKDVGMDPEMANRYPHEFSGGQRQRIGIARALAVGPKLIIADEPVSALDVSVQAQVLNLLRHLQQQHQLAWLLIAHDLAVVRYVCSRVYVMYAGRIMETGDIKEVYARPGHPYTRMLLEAVPDVEQGIRAMDKKSDQIRHPRQDSPEYGCPFASRCVHVMSICRQRQPAMVEIAPGQWCACYMK